MGVKRRITFTPPKGYTDFPAEETLVHFQPIANGMKPQAMALVHALMALTGQNVFLCHKIITRLQDPKTAYARRW